MTPVVCVFGFLRVDEGIAPLRVSAFFMHFCFFRQEQAPALQASVCIDVLHVSAPVVCVFGFLRVDEGIDPYGLAYILCVFGF